MPLGEKKKLRQMHSSPRSPSAWPLARVNRVEAQAAKAYLSHTRTTDASQEFSTSDTVDGLLPSAADHDSSVLRAALAASCLQSTFQPKLAMARIYL